MAKFSIDDLERQESNNNVSNDKGKVGYFNSLKNDKDETLVRFIYSKPEEFNEDLVKVHSVKVGSNYRFISCLREDYYDDITKCPLCANNEQIFSKVFIRLIEYTKNEKGNIVATPKIWCRPSKFALKLKNYLNEYDDLRKYVFKVIRNGVAGDMKTSYEILPTRKEIYPDNIYIKDFSAFDNFDLKYHSYYDLTKEEIENYLNTGEVVKTSTNNSNTANVNQNKQEDLPNFNFDDELPMFDNKTNQQQYQAQPNNVQQAVNNMAQAEQNPYSNTQQQTYTQGTQEGVANNTKRRVYSY